MKTEFESVIFEVGQIVLETQRSFTDKITGYKKGVVVKIDNKWMMKDQHCFFQIISSYDVNMNEKKTNQIGEVHDFFSSNLSRLKIVGKMEDGWIPDNTKPFWAKKNIGSPPSQM